MTPQKAASTAEQSTGRKAWIKKTPVEIVLEQIGNRNLTEWLVEYNFRRPHQALGYLPPINFSFKYHKVLPMYPSSTPG